MKFYLQNSFAKQSYHCLVVGFFENNLLSSACKKIDQISGGYLSHLISKQKLKGKIGETLLLHYVPHIDSECILLIGCGDQNKPLTPNQFRKIIVNSINLIDASNIKNVFFALTEVTVEHANFNWKIKYSVETLYESLYYFDEFKTKKLTKNIPQNFYLYFPEKNNLKAGEQALKQGLAVAKGVEYTKNLANLPSNVCTPTYLAQEAKLLKKNYSSLKVKILEEKEMKKLGMNAFLAVSQGSAQPGKLICIEYNGTTKKQAPIGLVGKGITFDTGGISLKSNNLMIGMKYDMCGAATVLGTLKAVAELKLPINIVGLLAAAENMPSGSAAKPEDIVTTLSGQTVEIMNTDAEGRLVLCDALTYLERYRPNIVIDIATLTGAVLIALGVHATGLVANNQPLADKLLAAGIQSNDRAWQMPLWEEYQEQITSLFADISNSAGRIASFITAGCFLSRFATKFQWAHLDVAGTAVSMQGYDRFATGRPVPMLMQFLIDYSHAKN